MTLEWTHTGRRQTSSGYCIDRLAEDGSSWSLGYAEPTHPPLGTIDSGMHAPFASLQLARAAAVRLEVLRVRRIKIIRHAMLALLLVGSAIAVLVAAVSAPPPQIAWFTIALVLAIGGSWEAASCVGIITSQSWDHLYDVPVVTALDGAVAGFGFTLFGAMRGDGPTIQQELVEDTVVIIPER